MHELMVPTNCACCPLEDYGMYACTCLQMRTITPAGWLSEEANVVLERLPLVFDVLLRKADMLAGNSMLAARLHAYMQHDLFRVTLHVHVQ